MFRNESPDASPVSVPVTEKLLREPAKVVGSKYVYESGIDTMLTDCILTALLQKDEVE